MFRRSQACQGNDLHASRECHAQRRATITAEAEALATLETLHQELHRDALDAEELEDKIAIVHALVEGL
jgi:hypothetical protein